MQTTNFLSDVNGFEFAILSLSAFALTGLFTWPVRALAFRLGAMDVPNIARKTQAEPVPYLGGVAIALGISIITFVAVFFTVEDRLILERGITAILPALILGAVGLVDDLKSLEPWPRLIVQTLVGTILSVVLVQSGTLGSPFGSKVLDICISVFWIVGICNSVNFFDNLDGAASGAVAISALGVFIIAFDRGQLLVTALAIVTVGATIGFLIWNKPPAKIYMGDAGALFLGVIISVLTIRVNPGITPTWKSLFIPVMLLAVPILDTCVAVFSRIFRGISPLTGGKDHLSHRLTRAGLSRRGAVLSLWGASGVCALLALGLYRYSETYGSLIIGVFVIGWLLALGLFLRTPSED